MKGLRFEWLPLHLFNLFHKFYHHVSTDEINLIKKTDLFTHVNEEQFKDILNSTELVKYLKNTLVFEEGHIGDALYIITEGSVRVFTYDIHGQKIPLARLNKGDYFGEQALIGQGSKTRNANIETIENTTLIKMPAKTIIPFWNKDQKLKIKLKKIGYTQAIHALKSSTQFYNEIQRIVEQFVESTVIDVPDDEVIFNFNEKPDNVYLILRGKVKLIFPAKDGHVQKNLILNKGHLFGELGVLENQPRTATAVAMKNSQLLVIEGSHFKQHYHKIPELKRLLSILKKSYQLPMQGIVEQYFGSTPEIGATITNIFKMDDGRTIVAIRSLHQDIFTMSVANSAEKSGEEYKYSKNEQNFAILRTYQNHLISIESYGDWSNLHVACRMMLDNESLDNSILNKFHESGELISQTIITEEIVCTCMSVSRSQIEICLAQGMTDFEDITRETGACTVCGSCKYKILELLGDNPWISATLKEGEKHNEHIRSYFLKPLTHQLKPFKPGQHIIIQAKIGGIWVERAYTLSDINYNEDGLRITIKKEPQGLFTQWLFNEIRPEIDINISQPQGDFILNDDDTLSALCFAGGIGVTPFITYIKDLAAKKSKKRLHIVYCAPTDKDFVLTDEFDAITHNLTNLTITYRSDTNGFLTDKEIINIVQSLKEPDIYICGPEGFERFISKTLNTINYNKSKIHSEQFVHAGEPTPVNEVLRPVAS